MRYFRAHFLAIALWHMANAMAANASTVLYTNRPLFEAELISPTTIDFNDQVTPPDLFTGYGPYPGGTVSLSGVTFTALSDAYLYAIDPAYNPAKYGLGDGVVLSWQLNIGGPNMLVVDMPADTLAVGFDFGRNFAGNSFQFQFKFGNADVFLLNTIDGASFAGFISDKPLTRMMIIAPENAYPQLDRFVFASSVNSNVPVPEPSSIALMVCGLGAIAACRQIRRAKA